MSQFKILSIQPCIDAGIKVIVTDFFNAGNLLLSPLYQNKIGSVVENGYDAFSFDSDFYNDICTPFTNEYGNDVLLSDRRKYYFLETLNICKDGCTFVGYNSSVNSYSCACDAKNIGSNDENNNEKEIITKQLPEDFYKTKTNSNIKVFKCANLVFSKKGQNKNFGSYALLFCFTSFVGVMVFFFLKGTKQLDTFIAGFIDTNPPANPPKNDEDPQSNEKSLNRNISNAHKDEILGEYELNNAEFQKAKSDDRSFKQLYWSLLKIKQLFIFTFYTYTDGNLRIIKIGLFILFIAFYLAFTALFFNDSIMRQIYLYKGNTNAAIYIPSIILSSLSCLIMSLVVKILSLSERDLYRLKQDKKLCNTIKRKMKIKAIVLFGISILLIMLFWYYVSAFCAVFKNSQGHYFINVLVAFIVCNAWPCVTSLIAPALRIYSIKHNHPCLYKASKIVAYI